MTSVTVGNARITLDKQPPKSRGKKEPQTKEFIIWRAFCTRSEGKTPKSRTDRIDRNTRIEFKPELQFIERVKKNIGAIGHLVAEADEEATLQALMAAGAALTTGETLIADYRLYPKAWETPEPSADVRIVMSVQYTRSRLNITVKKGSTFAGKKLPAGRAIADYWYARPFALSFRRIVSRKKNCCLKQEGTGLRRIEIVQLPTLIFARDEVKALDKKLAAAEKKRRKRIAELAKSRKGG